VAGEKTMTGAALPPHIFREYDIRGIVGVDFDAGIATGVGRAYATVLRRSHADQTPRVAVGYDNRPSSPDLVQGLIDGLRSAGVDVVDLGMVPTPLVYWAELTLGTDGGIMVTGSHNPAEWNGIKMTMGGKALYGAAIQELRGLIESGETASGAGSSTPEPIIERYIDDVVGRFRLARPVKVAIDCGNGTGSLVAVPLLERLGADVHPIYCDSDGTFPNHHPDPTVDENLVDLIALVRREGCEVGIALDGDADRVGAVDGDGKVVRGDILLLLFALDILERGRGSTVVFDVKCSQVLPEVFSQAGGEPIMWKTGHSLIKEKMRETGAPVAGELSGHICIADDYLGFDDALYCACRLVDLLARSEKPLSDLAGELPHYESTPEIRIDVTEENKTTLVRAAQEHFGALYEVNEVDGARILFGDGWGLLRASNTQPVIVARFEARTPERLAEIRAEVEGWLRTQGVDVQER
jgi:phosphomannomutase / phosphoglucomutase